MSKQNKSAKIRALLAEGKSTAEIAKAVKCSPKLVYVVRSAWNKDRTRSDLKKRILESHEKMVEEMSKPLYGGNAQRVDMVNAPPHYTDTDIEPINAIEAWQLNYRLGNVVKYVARANFKDNYLEDLKKARWYLDREITKSEEQ